MALEEQEQARGANPNPNPSPTPSPTPSPNPNLVALKEQEEAGGAPELRWRQRGVVELRLERLCEALHDGGGLGADAIEGGHVTHRLEQPLRPTVVAYRLLVLLGLHAGLEPGGAGP